MKQIRKEGRKSPFFSAFLLFSSSGAEKQQKAW
jgi:hypothetical protein